MAQMYEHAERDLERAALFYKMPREAQVLYLLANDHDQTDAARALGISRQRVSQLVTRARMYAQRREASDGPS